MAAISSLKPRFLLGLWVVLAALERVDKEVSQVVLTQLKKNCHEMSTRRGTPEGLEAAWEVGGQTREMASHEAQQQG